MQSQGYKNPVRILGTIAHAKYHDAPKMTYELEIC